MRVLLVAAVAIALVPGSITASPPLPRGNGDFRLGMSRAQVDSAIAARQLQVISNGIAFVVCTGDEPTVEYEQYSFLRAPHGADYLWRVTIGYRLHTSISDYAGVREELRRLLGEPLSDSWDPQVLEPTPDSRPRTTTQVAQWADPLVAVRLGGRWTDVPDATDRMMVSWTDRRLQRLVEARRKKDTPAN